MSSDRRKTPAGLAAAALVIVATSCFPELPNQYEITNLRVLSVKADPANLRLDQWPLPPITMRALAVDPLEPELDGVEHTWELELPDDFEGAEDLEALIPDGPYGTELEIDLSVLFGARDTTWTQGLLPLRYTAANAELTREAIKFAYFLVPEIDLGDDDDSAGDDDDSAGDDDDVPGDPDDEIPEGYNENPTLVSLTIGQTTFTAADGTLPGEAAPLFVGTVDRDDGLRLEIEVGDDKNRSDVDAELYWTHGSPGLPNNSPFADFEGGPSTDEDDDDDEDSPYTSRSASLEEGFLTPNRNFGWTPPGDLPDVPIRLFLVLVDDNGGQAWQEIRPEAAPDSE